MVPPIARAPGSNFTPGSAKGQGLLTEYAVPRRGSENDRINPDDYDQDGRKYVRKSLLWGWSSSVEEDQGFVIARKKQIETMAGQGGGGYDNAWPV